MRKAIVACTLGILLGVGWSRPARAQHPPAGMQLPSTAHATSRPLTSYKGTTHLRRAGEARIVPLRRPEKPGGGGPHGAPGGGGNWSDADLQSSYPSSQLTIGKVFQAFTFTGYLPPDENLSVGINSEGGSPQTQTVSVTNTSYRIFDTAGNLLVQGDLARDLFGTFTNSVCSSEDGGDPIALYDKLDHRWLISQLAYDSAFTSNHLCVAISQSSDATGSYNLYDFDFGSNLPDYPKLAVWSDGIYFSANIFANIGGNLLFQGAQACSFPRSDMTSSPGSIIFTCSSGTDSSIYNILPADLEGTTLPPAGTGPDYYLQFSDNLTSTSGNLLRVYQLQNGSLNAVGNLTVNDFHEACGGGTCIPQSGNPQLLDSLGDRLMYRLSYRNYGSYQQIVANHAVQVNSGSNQTGIRWYALRNNPGGSPPFTVFKESTYSPDSSTYRWMASIAQNKNGDLGLGYSTSGVTSVPSIAVTGLLSGTDAYMEQEQVLYPGQSYQESYSRWGDYSSISVDPTDDCSFWYTNEYITNPPLAGLSFLWQTVIGTFSFGDCASGTTADFSLTPQSASQTISPGDTATYSISVQSANGYSGTVNLSYGNCPTNATCSIAPQAVDLTTGGSQSATLSVTNTGSTPGGTYNIPITGKDSQDSQLTHTISVGLTVNTAPVGTFSLSASPGNLTLKAGQSGSYTIAISPSGGFASDVTVTADCPTGFGCSMSNSGLVPGGSGSVTYTVTNNSAPRRTSYTLNISASGGGVTQSTSVGLKAR